MSDSSLTGPVDNTVRVYLYTRKDCLVADLHYVANHVRDSDGCFLPRSDVSYNSNSLFELV